MKTVKIFHSSFVLALFTALFVMTASAANAQETPPKEPTKTGTASATRTITETGNTNQTTAEPVLTDYKGIRIGMSADEVRDKLDHLKEKGKRQDFFVFSDVETAQVYYDAEGKVRAITVNYVGESNAPKPLAVLGEDIQAKADGSMYEIKRYPNAGYWVAYNRTAGDDPIITVTMQKMR